MKKSRIILISCAVATAAVAVVCVLLAVLGFGKASEASERADKAVSAIGKVYARDPFPSEENIARAGTNALWRADWTKKLALAVDEGAYPPARGVTPGAFSQMRERVIESLTKSAPEGEDGKSILPENFAFGFERYSSGVPAEKAHVERLVRQLKAMEDLMGVVYRAGIVRLEAAGREVFEEGSPDDEGFSGRTDRPTTVSGSTITLPPLASPKGAVPLQRDRFALQFTAREGSLASILDAIDSMRPFAMVSSLSFEKIRPDVVFPDENEAERRAQSASRDDQPRRSRRHRRGASAEEEQESVPAAQPLNERPAPRSSRLVSGPLREAPIRVLMTVDFYSVPSSGARKGAAAGGAGDDEED